MFCSLRNYWPFIRLRTNLGIGEEPAGGFDQEERGTDTLALALWSKGWGREDKIGVRQNSSLYENVWSFKYFAQNGMVFRISE